MANLIQRAAGRLLGLPAPEDLAALKGEIDTLKTKVRMKDARLKETASGVPSTYGQFDYEYLTALSASQRWDVYDRMESDPHIKSGLDRILLPLITGKWEIQAAGDKPQDVEIAEFVSACLLRTASDKYGREYWVQTSWRQRLIEILDMLKCGFALFAKSTREVEGKWVYDRLQWLEPRSVDPHGWDLSPTDELIAVKRTYRTANLAQEYRILEPIPAKQLALYVWDLKGARLEGRPRIRSAYGAFTRKDFMLKQAAIWAQKVGAPMPVAHYPSLMSPAEVAVIEQAVQAARGEHTAEAYALFPMSTDGQKVEIEFLGVSEGGGQVDRMRGLINGENAEIAHALDTKSKQLGETDTGSRAVGQTQSEDEDISVQAVADLVMEMENHGIGNLPGLIQQLVDWNFPGVKRYPELKVSRIGPREDTSTLTPLIAAVTAGLVPKTVSVMKQATEKFGLYLKDEEYEAAIQQAEERRQEELNAKRAAPAGAQEKGGPPEKREAPPVLNRKLSIVSGTALAAKPRIGNLFDPAPGAAPIGDGRPPNNLEAHLCRLSDVKRTMDTGTNDVHNDLRVIRDGMILDLQARLRAGMVNTRNIEGLRRSRYRGTRKASERLQATLERIGETGAEHVAQEIDRAR